VTPDPLVDEYLNRLDIAARALTPDRRRELAGDVREHIDAALVSEGNSDPATVRNVLERLGQPEEIVAAEGGPGPAAAEVAAPVASPGRAWGAIEVAAILLLFPGAIVLPVVGPMVGIGLLWLSTAWSTRVKVVVTVIAVLLAVLPVALVLGVGSGAGSSS
jgi:uncharacterized membrane protein